MFIGSCSKMILYCRLEIQFIVKKLYKVHKVQMFV